MRSLLKASSLLAILHEEASYDSQRITLIKAETAASPVTFQVAAKRAYSVQDLKAQLASAIGVPRAAPAAAA